MWQLLRPTALMMLALMSPVTVAGDGGGTKHDARVPAAPQLSVSAQSRTLRFSWDPIDGVTHYLLMSNPDGHSGFSPVGHPMPARASHRSIAVSVHLLDWENATYFLSACNRHGCSNSNRVTVAKLESQAIDVIPAPQFAARFDTGLALSGDGRTLAVSNPRYGESDELNYAGAVFVYRKSKDGWQLEAKLQQPIPLLGDAFGSAIAISADGRMLAIGCDQEGTPRMGTVYVFARGESAWTLLSQLSSSAAAPPYFGGVLFGAALDLSASGDVLAVGAPFEQVEAEQGVIERAGVVYVFRLQDRERGVWHFDARITLPHPEADDRFGANVTVSGNGRRLIALTGEQNDVTQAPEDGYGDRINTLHAFSNSSSGWKHEAAIEAPPGSTFFGGSAHNPSEIINARALETNWQGDLLAVGVGRVFQEQHRGAVRIYARVNNRWSLSQQITPPADREGFGDVLAMSANGKMLAVRVQMLTPPAPAVVILERSHGQWAERNVVTRPDSLLSGTEFGQSLALSRAGRTLAVGAEETNAFVLVY